MSAQALRAARTLGRVTLACVFVAGVLQLLSSWAGPDHSSAARLPPPRAVSPSVPDRPPAPPAKKLRVPAGRGSDHPVFSGKTELTVRTEPPADVSIDGEPLPRGQTRALSPGTHDVLFWHDEVVGGRRQQVRQHRTVHLSEGTSIVLDMVLRDGRYVHRPDGVPSGHAARRHGADHYGSRSGALRINTRPWSQVYIDGVLVGNTPQMKIPLKAGRHQVVLFNPDFELRETLTVTVEPGETITKVLNLR